MRKRSAIERAVEWLAENGKDSELSEQIDNRRAPRLTAARPKRRSAPARHSRKCSVCRHRERPTTVELTANSVVLAIELLARLDADGRLTPPVTHVIHQSSQSAASSAEASRHAATTTQNGQSNRQNRQVGHNATS